MKKSITANWNFSETQSRRGASTEDLQQAAANANSSVFLSKISRFLKSITASSAYWQKAKEDLKAIITHAGPLTFFFTFKSADLHWPELHTRFKSENTAPTVENHHENVMNNPHITDWFFTQRLEIFIKHWRYHSLDAKWHWYRYEYRPEVSFTVMVLLN